MSGKGCRRCRRRGSGRIPCRNRDRRWHEAEQKDNQGKDRAKPPLWVKLRRIIYGSDSQKTHDQQQRAPNVPAWPIIQQAKKKQPHRQEQRQGTVCTRAHRAQNVSAVELSTGQQVQCGREQSNPRRAAHRMQKQISRYHARPQNRDEQAHDQRLPENNRSMRIRKRHHARIKHRNNQRWDREQEPNNRSREAHVK